MASAINPRITVFFDCLNYCHFKTYTKKGKVRVMLGLRYIRVRVIVCCLNFFVLGYVVLVLNFCVCQKATPNLAIRRLFIDKLNLIKFRGLSLFQYLP